MWLKGIANQAAPSSQMSSGMTPTGPHSYEQVMVMNWRMQAFYIDVGWIGGSGTVLNQLFGDCFLIPCNPIPVESYARNGGCMCPTWRVHVTCQIPLPHDSLIVKFSSPCNHAKK